MTNTLSPNRIPSHFHSPAPWYATQDDAGISVGNAFVLLHRDAGSVAYSGSTGETKIQSWAAQMCLFDTMSHTEIIPSSPKTNLSRIPFMDEGLAVGFGGEWVERYVSAIEDLGTGGGTPTPPSTQAIRSARAIVKLLWSSGERKPERIAATHEGVIIWIDTAKFHYYICYDDGTTMRVRDDDEWQVDPLSGEIDDFGVLSNPESLVSFETQLPALVG